MLSLIFILAARGYPNGNNIACNPQGHTLPVGVQNAKLDIDTTCVRGDGTVCTVKISTGEKIKGFVISSTYGTITTGAGRVVKNNGMCLLHDNANDKAQIDFAWNPPKEDITFTTIYITIVSGKNQGHKVGYDTVRLSNFNNIYIIGAGPGGLSAARWIHKTFPDINLKVYERGTTPRSSWYTNNISSTANEPKTNNVMHSNSSQYDLVSMIGGQQNINGAVYAPGTPEALAGSLEINVTEARFLQHEAGKYVHKEDHMMWECINPPDCDPLTFAAANIKMARRSIAYDLPSSIGVETGADVQRVNDSAIMFSNGTVVVVGEDDRVILAAGALTSPQLIGVTDFYGWNHYFFTDSSPNPGITKQTFLYPDKINNNTELNQGLYYPNNFLQVNMSMHPTQREHHVVGQDYANPHETNLGTQAWHFAGTMNHTRSKIDNYDRLFAGDAGALKTPFNCHTSMPAAAAGILAAHEALGVPVGALDVVRVPEDIKLQEITTEELAVTYAWSFIFLLFLISDIKGFAYKRSPSASPIEYVAWGRLIF